MRPHQPAGQNHGISLLPGFQATFGQFQSVLEPDRNLPQWWAGAPSVVHTPGGNFYLACRMREGNSPRGQRGYENRILESSNGISFQPVASVSRDQLGARSVERPSLVQDPKSGLFRLYACVDNGTCWEIIKFSDVANPVDFDPATAHPVLTPRCYSDEFVHLAGYKDPFIFYARDRWHMFVIGFDLVERTYHFTSADGETWDPDPRNPVFDNGGWHNFYTRPACVVPLGIGYLFVYEGSNASWHDPIYNILTGLGFTLDLSRIVDLTPEAPVVASTTPGDYHTWRYSHWLPLGNELWVYAETSRPNNTNEIRLTVLHRG